MSNFPKPDELEELLEQYSEKLEEFGDKFDQIFREKSLELKAQTDSLRSRIEKYANFSRDYQLQHLVLSDLAKTEITSVHIEVEGLKSKFGELEKMFHLKQNLQ
ncbi:MAG: hypothetical protein S4CHLAM6_08050 [Chlamydiae bacterium]|nr:hypothetical protein [Chlamydiota bacterium]